MSFFSKDYLNPPNQQSYTAELLQIFKQYRLDEAGITVLSHSNGTMVHSWLLKEEPSLFTRNCLVDPVTFCTFSLLSSILSLDR